jgi:glycerol uptake facilitator-like aquaporin
VTTLPRRLTAEWLGTALLLATIIGSGIMANKLAGGNTAVALMGNTIPTGAILVVLIAIFAPVSGAHFNPAVSLAMLLRGNSSGSETGAYCLFQVLGGLFGMIAAHLMFDLPLLQTSTTVRSGFGQWSAELIATFGLLTVIFNSIRYAPSAVALNVGLYITAAYWFTASTSFANPAVTIARALTDTFSGIRPADAPAFIAAQIAGTLAAVAFDRWFASSRVP